MRRVPDPQETHLGAEVGSVSAVGEEGLGVTGSAGCHTGALRHRVVVDVFRQDAAILKENSGESESRWSGPGETGDLTGSVRIWTSTLSATCWRGGC